MKLTIKLNLDVLVATAFTDSFYFEFTNITNLQHWYDEENVTQLEFEQSSLEKRLYVFDDGATSPTYHEENGDIVTLSENSDYIIFTCEISSYVRLMEFIQKGIIEVNQNGNTTIFAYKQNSENDVIDKTLTFVNAIDGKFNHMIGLKNVNIDIKDYARDYNYIYIPSLSRYYYVDSVELVSADISRLHLKEDVLMSWKDLIKTQKAFVTRYENASEQGLVDVRLPLADRLRNIDVPNVIDTIPSQSRVNCTFDFNNYAGTDYPNILVVSMSTKVSTYRDHYVPAPVGTTLPNISSRLNGWEFVRFIKPSDLFYLTLAYRSDDAVSSYIQSVLWLPFNCTSTFGLVTESSTAIFVRDKYINYAGEYVPYNSSDSPLTCYRPDRNSDGECPYLIVKDFTCSLPTGNFYEREPYTNYEIYIPFVGWVKIESTKFINKRIWVYYTLDIQSGISTAYIYNYTDDYVIWSGTCTIGFKLDLTTTNQLENIKQKQSNDLNMLLGLMSSALAIGVGVATENPVAISGGILSAGKTIASNVNSNRMLFERAQMSFGTSDGALHSNYQVKLRKSIHETLNIDLSVYKHMQGLPYNNYVDSLSTLTGYVEIGEIHFDPKENNIYQDEISEIVELLQKGVIF